jgi:succinate-acetate transporter protein
MTASQSEYDRELAATAGVEPGAVAPSAAVAPRVLVSGGEPLALGLMAFALGTLVVGMGLVGVFPASALGGVIPIVAGFCGIALFTASWWSLLLGESLLAATFGTVSGFFFSLALLLLGIFHNWYGVAPADVPSVEEIFYIVWCCFFLALFVPFLRLPAIYPLTVFLVVTLLALAASSVFAASPNIQTAAGAATLATSFLLFWEWLNVTMTSVGMSKVPPLGKILAG